MARGLTVDDRWLFAEGRHLTLYEVLGCHLDEDGATFRVWAPNATVVSVVGDFNDWNSATHPMVVNESGIWESRVEEIKSGDTYKYRLVSKLRGYQVDKADPYAFHAETPPATASKAWSLDYQWNDVEWLDRRQAAMAADAPISIYEMHIGSWRRDGWVTYRNLAPMLGDYLVEMGFTHVEFLPVMEHPYYGSWGYQSTGYFAPTSRYGTPQDLMYLIDQLHQRGIGVILDWVPSHFATDEHGLGFFDGTHLYEHADPRLGFHPDWSSFIFNYDRHEVSSFLLSSAAFWLDRYHVDGLRVDAVASMLYLDYSRPDGGWIPNRYGGRENLGAIEFLRRLTGAVHQHHPGTVVIAEESTSWPQVTGAVEDGGLGFDYKWDMGWMNDTLRYVRLDPLFRSHPDNHRLLSFRGLYAHTERFVLSLSHDEVVHGKRSLAAKQHGDGWRQQAGVRALFGYQWGLNGKKLLFMGSEFGQWSEWNHESALHWEQLDDEASRDIQRWVMALNRLYAGESALHRGDHQPDGFRWVEADDYERAALAWLRLAPESRPVLVLANFTPVHWDDYLVGVPVEGEWELLASSDHYGGNGMPEWQRVGTMSEPNQNYDQSLRLTLPALSVLFLAPVNSGEHP